jgi:dihydrofolate reductase
MAQLLYSAITSLDGYVADEQGAFDWSMPDEEVHAYINDLHRPVGTYLYGRRLYDVMVVWETWEADDDISADWAQIWRGAEKVVYSTSLPEVSSARTRIERTFDAASVRGLKATSAQDLTVGGPDLAGQAFAANLIDECHLFVSPVVVGGGTPVLPRGVRLDLELRNEHRFGNGVVHLHYAVRN